MDGTLHFFVECTWTEHQILFRMYLDGTLQIIILDMNETDSETHSWKSINEGGQTDGLMETYKICKCTNGMYSGRNL